MSFCASFDVIQASPRDIFDRHTCGSPEAPVVAAFAIPFDTHRLALPVQCAVSPAAACRHLETASCIEAPEIHPPASPPDARRAHCSSQGALPLASVHRALSYFSRSAFSASRSSSLSATIFLSLRFSSSRVLSLRRSDSSRPP